MADPTTITQQIVSESPAIEAYKTNVLKTASDLAYNVNQPSLASQLPQYQVAGFAPSQQTALHAAANTGIGSFAPYVNTAQQYLTGAAGTTGEAADIARTADTRNQYAAAQQAMSNAGQSAANISAGLPLVQAGGIGALGGMGMISGAQGQYDPNSVAQYMNPYTQQVLQNQLQEMNRQAQIQQQANQAQAVRAGAFGGGRAAIVDAETQRNLAQLQNQEIAKAYSQNYGQAQAASLQAFEQAQQRALAGGQAMGALGTQLGNLGAQQGNIYATQAGAEQQLGQGIGSLAAQQYGIGQNLASTLGTLGGQMGNLGVQQAALGQTAQQMNQTDINNLYASGQAQQALNQQQLDATRANALQKVYAPYQQAGFLSDIYKGAPSTQMATTAASQATPSPFMQALGTGIAATSAAAAAKKSGLF